MRLRMKIPRQPARYGAECSISVYREACYCLQNCAFCRAVNSNFPISFINSSKISEKLYGAVINYSYFLDIL